MPASATRLQVQSFLAKLANVPPETILLSRQKKNLAFLDRIDYDSNDVIRVLKQLIIEDYSYGPNC